MTGSEHEHGHGHRAHAVAAGHASHRRRIIPRIGRWSRRWAGLRWNWTSPAWSWPGLNRAWNDLRRRALRLARSRFVQRLFWGSAACFAIATLAALGLWWRLSSGPIELDMATPWLKAAIEENFGGNGGYVSRGTPVRR